MITSFPTDLPAGTNLPAVWSVLVTNSIPAPSTGFTTRLLLLLIIATFLIVAISIHTSVQWELRRRNHTKWWLWRTVNRTAGRYVVVNSMTVKELGAAFMIVYAAGQVILTWRGYNLKVSFPLAYDWSEIGIWPFSFVFCWVWTFSSFQTYLLLKDDTQGRLKWLTARVTNAIFLSWLIFIGVCLFVMVGFGVKSNHQVWDLRDGLIRYCKEQSAEWDASADNSAIIATADDMLNNYNRKNQTHLNLMGRLWGAYVATQAGTLIVNFATYPLLTSLRHQIKTSLADVQLQTVMTADNIRQADHDAVDYLAPAAGAGAGRGPKIPSLQEVREMAARQSSGLEAAKRLRTMARVASDLQGQIIALVAISLSIVGGCAFFAVVFPTLADRPWVMTEMVLLYPVWAMLVPMTGGFILFAWNAVSELKQTQMSDVDWSPPKAVPAIEIHVPQARGAGGMLPARNIATRCEDWDPEASLAHLADEEEDETDEDLMAQRSRDEESGTSLSASGGDKDRRSF